MPSCEKYHLPKDLRQHIDYITPGIKLLAPVESHFSQKKAAAAAAESALKAQKRNLNHHALSNKIPNPPHTDPNDLSTCDIAITPACVAALYKIPRGTSKHPNNSLGIFESELQFYTQLDLNAFFGNYSDWIPGGTHPIAANVDGGQQSTEDLYYVSCRECLFSPIYKGFGFLVDEILKWRNRWSERERRKRKRKWKWKG